MYDVFPSRFATQASRSSADTSVSVKERYFSHLPSSQRNKALSETTITVSPSALDVQFDRSSSVSAVCIGAETKIHLPLLHSYVALSSTTRAVTPSRFSVQLGRSSIAATLMSGPFGVSVEPESPQAEKTMVSDNAPKRI